MSNTNSKEIRDAYGLSKELQVLPSRQNVIFKLMSKKNGGVNRIPFSSFHGTDVIYDPGQENEWDRDITLKYVASKHTTTNKLTGEKMIEEIIGDIEFDGSGVCIVKPTEYSKLVFMRRANYCATNKYRDKGVQAKWYEEAPGKSKTELLHSEIRIADCSRIISLMTSKELQANCKKFELNHNAPIDDMKYSLILEAKKDPDIFINSVGNIEDKVKIVIENALGLGFIERDFTNNTWIWTESKEVITSFTPDKTDDETLLEFLTSMKGKPTLKELKKILE